MGCTSRPVWGENDLEQPKPALGDPGGTGWRRWRILQAAREGAASVGRRIRLLLAALDRVPVWLVGLFYLVLGLTLATALMLRLAQLPVVGLHRPNVGLVAAIDAAVVAGVSTKGALVAGQPVRIVWQVTNTGETAWDPASYRFIPATDGLPVLPVPRTLPSQETATVQVDLEAPARVGVWEMAWRLTGPQGAVDGGEVRLAVMLHR